MRLRPTQIPNQVGCHQGRRSVARSAAQTSRCGNSFDQLQLDATINSGILGQQANCSHRNILLPFGKYIRVCSRGIHAQCRDSSVGQTALQRGAIVTCPDGLSSTIRVSYKPIGAMRVSISWKPSSRRPSTSKKRLIFAGAKSQHGRHYGEFAPDVPSRAKHSAAKPTAINQPIHAR